MESTNTNTNRNMKKRKVAILFYGLTRSLHKTISSLHKHLFNVLKDSSIDYDIFIHTYKIYGKYENKWSNEYTLQYKNEDVVSLLNPKYFLFDNQADIIKKIPFDEYYDKLGCWTGETPEMTKYLIKNLCLALYSKKCITRLFEKHKNDYDYAIISRPDLEYTTSINVAWLDELNEQNIIIPECDSYSGCNDRFCLGKPNNVIYYGTLFKHLKSYSKKTSIISEKYMLDMLLKKGIHILYKNILYNTIRMTIPQPEETKCIHSYHHIHTHKNIHTHIHKNT
jgi:hypothetical protein